jgi:hypothetical protein
MKLLKYATEMNSGRWTLCGQKISEDIRHYRLRMLEGTFKTVEIAKTINNNLEDVSRPRWSSGYRACHWL